ncbi:MAG: hypothetical protein ABIJ56_16015 [Pseudomonadota bacterium]
MRKITLFFTALLVVSFLHGAGHARPVRMNVIDSDAESCDVVFIGKIKKITPTGIDKSGPEILDLFEVKTKVLIPVKGGLKKDDPFSFDHWDVNAATPPMINGLSSFPLEKDKIYLFFLEKTDDGKYRLAAPESYGVEFPAKLIPALAKAPKGKSPAAHVINILVRLVEKLKGDCHAPVWLLSTSKMFKDRLKMKKVRENFVKTLVKLTKTAKDENTMLTVYSFLGELNETSVIPDIVNFIVIDQETKIIKQNAVNWLQLFPDADQVTALEQIIDQSKDSCVVQYAKKRLKACKQRMKLE